MLFNYLERKANFSVDPQQTMGQHTEAFPGGKKVNRPLVCSFRNCIPHENDLEFRNEMTEGKYDGVSEGLLQVPVVPVQPFSAHEKRCPPQGKTGST